jgi:hypothetical protein
MNLIWWIIVSTCVEFVYSTLGYKTGWWRRKLFEVGGFLIGFGLVYLPIFPYGMDNNGLRFFYGIISGLFSLQCHGILTKHLYAKLPDKK